MIQSRQRLGLLLEAPFSLRITREILREDLDRYIAVEPRVPRAKHFAHPAHADGRCDLVRPETSAFRGVVWSCVGPHLSRPTFLSSSSQRGSERRLSSTGSNLSAVIMVPRSASTSFNRRNALSVSAKSA